jgi:hypothetical protein
MRVLASALCCAGAMSEGEAFSTFVIDLPGAVTCS